MLSRDPQAGYSARRNEIIIVKPRVDKDSAILAKPSPLTAVRTLNFRPSHFIHLHGFQVVMILFIWMF